MSCSSSPYECKLQTATKWHLVESDDNPSSSVMVINIQLPMQEKFLQESNSHFRVNTTVNGLNSSSLVSYDPYLRTLSFRIPNITKSSDFTIILGSQQN